VPVDTSPEEDRRWRELADQLRRDRRLAVRLARFNAIAALRRGGPAALRRGRPAARRGASSLAVAAMAAIVGACTGLSLLITGVVEHSYGLSRAGLAVLVTVSVLSGIALVAIGTASARSGR
jgi:hypothetical protein